MAGLRCADVLLQHGFRVTVIEGRDRIGGRIHQKALPNGRLADMGPNWIHGTDDNPIMDLARETKTSMEAADADTYIFDQAGRMYPVKESARYTTIMWDIIQDAFKYSNKYGHSISESTSLFDFVKDQVKQRVPQSENNYEATRTTILKLSEMWGAYIGSPVDRQSLKFFWLEECIEGGK
jgi:phytoene dehydrogenase-like protein